VNLPRGQERSERAKRGLPTGRPGEHARLSGVADELLDRRVGVGCREEPPRYESGFRAHGGNQRFHRLLRHAVARALTTAPGLAGVSRAAADILISLNAGRKSTREHHLPPRTNREELLSSLSALGASHRVGWSCPGFSIPLWAVRRPDESGSWPGQDRRRRRGGGTA
jgi:hypothetical protein